MCLRLLAWPDLDPVREGRVCYGVWGSVREGRVCYGVWGRVRECEGGEGVLWKGYDTV